MLSRFHKFSKNNKGATAIEYGLIAALISIAAVVAFGVVGTTLSSTMGSVGTKMENASP